MDSGNPVQIEIAIDSDGDFDSDLDSMAVMAPRPMDSSLHETCH